MMPRIYADHIMDTAERVRRLRKKRRDDGKCIDCKNTTDNWRCGECMKLRKRKTGNL